MALVVISTNEGSWACTEAGLSSLDFSTVRLPRLNKPTDDLLVRPGYGGEIGPGGHHLRIRGLHIQRRVAETAEHGVPVRFHDLLIVGLEPGQPAAQDHIGGVVPGDLFGHHKVVSALTGRPNTGGSREIRPWQARALTCANIAAGWRR